MQHRLLQLPCLRVDLIGKRRKLRNRAGLVARRQTRNHGELRRKRVGKLLCVALDGGKDFPARHVQHRLRLNADGLDVVFHHDLVARLNFCLREDLEPREHRNVLFFENRRHRVRRHAQVQKSALFGRLFDPRIVVAVAVEDDALVFMNRAANQVVQRAFKIVCLLKLVCKEL